MTLVVGIIAFVAGLALGALWGALANMAGAADERNYAAEVAELEKRLRICQEVSIQNQNKAENYYQLFREGARANAQLQKENGYAHTN